MRRTRLGFTAVRALLALLLATACGRLDFALLDDAADAAPSPLDARTGPPCPVAVATPDPITIDGEVFRYTSFDGAHVGQGPATARVFDAAMSELDNDPTASDGLYSLIVPTGLVPVDVTLRYEVSGYLPSVVHLDQPLDRSIAGASAALWELGDAPVWNPTMMDMVYATVAIPHDDTRATVNVAIRTCSGASIAGITVAVDPAPAALAYTTPTGVTTDATQTPSSHAVAFNVPVGPVRITATDPSGNRTFPSLAIVTAANTNHLVILRAYE